MKKRDLYFMLVACIFTMACSNNENQSEVVEIFWDSVKSEYASQVQICGSASDAILFTEPWTEEIVKSYCIEDEIIQAMSTCGLLKTYIEHPLNVVMPFSTISSNLDYPRITNFNAKINQDKIVLELLERNDFVPALAAKYLSMIEQKGEKTNQEQHFEMLVASDTCFSMLKDKERIQFLVMALKMMGKDPSRVIETRHIMVAVMKGFNYTAFLTEAEKYHRTGVSDADRRTGFSEWSGGYDVCSFDVVEKYAKQFLNEQNKNEL